MNDYIQAVNTSFAIFSKSGTLEASFSENSLWSGTGANPCNGSSMGDPIVLYDTLADRWILSNFAFAVSGGGVPTAPFYQCVAASMTSDPVSGGWYRYAIRTDLGSAGTPPIGTLNDYSKFGLWTDCLYFAANGYAMPSETFIGAEFGSFSRSDLYGGLPLTGALGFINNATDPTTMIPSNLRGTSVGGLPPAGTPNYFVSESPTAAAFEVRRFKAGTNCGGGSLSAATNVSQAPSGVPAADSVAQPNTAIGLDPIDDRLMQKVQYRKVGSAESLWLVHTVQPPSGSTVSPQWAEINVSGGTIATTPVQEQIFSPDMTLNRWMGSIAADKDGNVALGYSTSNGSSPHFPSIAYAGRLATDKVGTLPRTEVTLVAGAGSQTNNCGGAACHRWGDYSAMTVDPVDDCTFWYVNQYYSSQANGTSGNWQTRIGSFKFPSCVSAPDTAPPTIISRSPLANATNVSLSPTITAQFGEAVTGVSTTSMALSNTADLVNLAATVTYDPATRKASLHPNAPLQMGATYRAALSGRITDVAGNPLAWTTWTFSTAAPVTVKLGSHTGYQFNASGAVTAIKTFTLPSSSTSLATRRQAITRQSGTWLAISGGVWAGYWMRESSVFYLSASPISAPPGSNMTFSPPASLAFKLGTHTGYKFSSTGAMTAQKTFTLASASTALTTKRSSSNAQAGKWFMVSSGVWAGYWVRSSDVIYLTP